jgi:hypothetical protein
MVCQDGMRDLIPRVEMRVLVTQMFDVLVRNAGMEKSEDRKVARGGWVDGSALFTFFVSAVVLFEVCKWSEDLFKVMWRVA